MKKSVRNILLGFLFVTSYLLLAFSPALAQNYSSKPAIQNQYLAPNTNSDVPNNFHNYTQSVMLEVTAGLSCLIAGIDPINPNGKCLGFDIKTGRIGYIENGGGAVGAMGNMIGMLYTPPAHTRDYIVNLAQNFGITKSTYAMILWDGGGASTQPSQPGQGKNGTGFEGISPLIKVWEAFKNIVYLIFVLIFIVIGVAVMLRVRIDPRTVMTIQNQIPKIIMGLILVTFSFAIAGFLIDLMWVVIYLVYGIFASIPGVHVSSLNPQEMAGTTPLGAFGGLGAIGNLAGHASWSIKSIMASIFDNAYGRVIATIMTTIMGGSIVAINPIAGMVGAAVGLIGGALFGNQILGFIGGFIAFLIIIIALLWALIRVWFALISAYVMILIDVVFAPFWILAGLIPGSKLSFSSWVRDIVANLAAFPTVIVMFLLAKTFMDIFAQGGFGQFIPPLIGNAGNMKSFGALIALGIVLTTPNAVRMMRTALSAPQIDLSTVGTAVGAGTAYLVAVGRGVGQTIAQSGEAIMRRNRAGQYEWGERGIARSFLGRFFR